MKKNDDQGDANYIQGCLSCRIIQSDLTSRPYTYFISNQNCSCELQRFNRQSTINLKRSFFIGYTDFSFTFTIKLYLIFTKSSSFFFSFLEKTEVGNLPAFHFTNSVT